jgi:hypothetical protein
MLQRRPRTAIGSFVFREARNHRYKLEMPGFFFRYSDSPTDFTTKEYEFDSMKSLFLHALQNGSGEHQWVQAK